MMTGLEASVAHDYGTWRQILALHDVVSAEKMISSTMRNAGTSCATSAACAVASPIWTCSARSTGTGATFSSSLRIFNS